MKVKVKFFSILRLYLGFGEMDIELPEQKTLTVRELIDFIDAKIDKKIKDKLLDGENIKRGTMVLLNGKNILHLKGLDTEVHDGDVVVFFPPGGGG